MSCKVRDCIWTAGSFYCKKALVCTGLSNQSAIDIYVCFVPCRGSHTILILSNDKRGHSLFISCNTLGSLHLFMIACQALD